MSNSAAFSITGTTSGASASSAGGHDAVHGETLTFALEASPGLDILSAVYEVVVASDAAASALSLSGSGVPTPTPLDGVTTTAPSAPEVSSWLVRCTVTKASGVETFTRLVAIGKGTSFGKTVRKMVASESQEYDATYGWAQVFADIVDALPDRANIQTPDATPVIVRQYADMADGDVMHMEVRAVAIDTVTGDVANYVYVTAFKRIAGTVTLVATYTPIAHEDDATWALDLLVDTNKPTVRVTGDATNPVNWKLSIRRL